MASQFLNLMVKVAKGAIDQFDYEYRMEQERLRRARKRRKIFFTVMFIIILAIVGSVIFSIVR